MKIEKELGLEEGFLMTLQIFYDIKQEKLKMDKDSPDLSKLRPALFWDTDIKKIHWRTQAHAVIQRVFQRGNEKEMQEIERFYGKPQVVQVIQADGRGQ